MVKKTFKHLTDRWKNVDKICRNVDTDNEETVVINRAAVYSRTE